MIAHDEPDDEFDDDGNEFVFISEDGPGRHRSTRELSVDRSVRSRSGCIKGNQSPKTTPMKHCPTVIGCMLCEASIRDDGTRNVSMINCFTARATPSVPAQLPGMTLAARLTDGQGSFEISVSVFELSTLQEVYARKYVVSLDDRLASYWCRLKISNLVIPRFGAYQIVLKADGEFLAHCPLSVLEE